MRDWIAEAIVDRVIHPCQKLTLKGEKSYREKLTKKRQEKERSGAGEEGRTPDLMLGKHTL